MTNQHRPQSQDKVNPAAGVEQNVADDMDAVDLRWSDGYYRDGLNKPWVLLEQLEEKFPLPSEKVLTSLLIRLTKHVEIRDAMGEISKEFCKGCKHGRLKPCPLPEVIKVIGKYKK